MVARLQQRREQGRGRMQQVGHHQLNIVPVCACALGAGRNNLQNPPATTCNNPPGTPGVSGGGEDTGAEAAPGARADAPGGGQGGGGSPRGEDCSEAALDAALATLDGHVGRIHAALGDNALLMVATGQGDTASTHQQQEMKFKRQQRVDGLPAWSLTDEEAYVKVRESESACVCSVGGVCTNQYELQQYIGRRRDTWLPRTPPRLYPTAPHPPYAGAGHRDHWAVLLRGQAHAREQKRGGRVMRAWCRAHE